MVGCAFLSRQNRMEHGKDEGEKQGIFGHAQNRGASVDSASR
jgi:hypothetical protein